MAITTQTFSVTVVGVPLVITSVSPPDGQVGTAYTHTFLATGGVTPYLWSVASGILPLGLSLSAGGVMNGLPTQTGNFDVTVAVADVNG